MSVLHMRERAWAVSPLFVVGERKTVISLDKWLEMTWITSYFARASCTYAWQC